MTVLSGEKAASILSGSMNARLSTELSEHTVDYWPTHLAEIRSFAEEGLFSSAYPYNLPVEAGYETKVGNHTTTYLDDLYYRVHVKPRIIDFGNLINTEVEDLVIWNATFDFALLDAPGAPSQPGVSVTLPEDLVMPYFLKPLEEVVADVTAFIDGPPTVDSSFTITIDGVDYVVRAIGRRIVLWPFPPNWKTPLDDTYAFKSWALRSADGHVQSGSQWGNNPRREIEYNVLLKRDDAQRADNLLMGWQSRFYGVVCWPDKTTITADIAPGAVVIPCDTSNRAFAPGGFFALYENVTTYESGEILEVTPTSITVTSPLTRAWTAGYTRVYPVFAGVINSQISGVRHTDGVIEMPVSFECEPSTTYGNTPVGPATATYRGEELYLGRLNWVASLAFEYASDYEKIDFNTGRFYSFSESEFTPQNKEHTWLFKNRADAQAFRNWLGRREGVARPVYMPTGNTDLTLIADPLAASNVIDVVENDYQLLGAHPARRDIIVVMKDGTYFTRRVEAVAPTPGAPGGLRLTLDVLWDATIDRTAVKRISFLGLFRQVSNKSTIRWYTEDKGTANMRLITDRND